MVFQSTASDCIDGLSTLSWHARTDVSKIIVCEARYVICCMLGRMCSRSLYARTDIRCVKCHCMVGDHVKCYCMEGKEYKTYVCQDM